MPNLLLCLSIPSLQRLLPTSHMCPEMGQSAHECSTLRPSFPLEKTIRVKDLSNQLGERVQQGHRAGSMAGLPGEGT